MGTPACGRWSHTYLHCYTHLMLVFNTSDYRTIGLPCVDKQTKANRGPWMQLAIERNTSLLVDCPSHFLHATVPTNTPTSIHREVWRLWHLLELGEGRRQHRGRRLCHDPPERESLQWQMWISKVLAGEPQLVVPNPLEVLFPLLPLGPPNTQTNWSWDFQKIRDWLEFKLVDHCFTKTWPKLHGLSYGLFFSIVDGLLLNLASVAAALSASGLGLYVEWWVALGSSSWGNPWHENGSCQVTAACLRRASLPSHEKTRKGRSLSTQPRSSM